MNAPADLTDSITWWGTATIWATVAAAAIQILSWLLSLAEYYRKESPRTQILIFLDHRLRLERWSLHSAGAAALVALAAAFFSIGYARRADQDSLEVHKQLADAQGQSASASETAKQALIELTQTKAQLATVTKQLADADQQLATARQRLQAVEQEQNLGTLIMRMNADDAEAYDSLRTFKGPLNPMQAAAVGAALKTVLEAHRSAYAKYHPLERHVLSPEEAILSVGVADSYSRAAALEALALLPPQPKLMSKVVHMSLSDPSLDVRTVATRLVNVWTGQRFRALDKDQLQGWWEKYGKNDYPMP